MKQKNFTIHLYLAKHIGIISHTAIYKQSVFSNFMSRSKINHLYIHCGACLYWASAQVCVDIPYPTPSFSALCLPTSDTL